MSVDKNKISAEATRLLQKGQLDKAIRAYERILASDPADTRALLKIGEIQQKKGDLPAAAETFGRVAEAYGSQGFFLKAVAVYKQVLKLTPDAVSVSERLAGLYQQLGLVSESMAQLHAIVRWAERAGDEQKLLEALRRVVELDPDDVPSSVKLGDLYARLEQPKIAVEYLRRAADNLKRNERLDEYAKVGERLVALLPDDLVLARELATVYLARSDARRALHHLQQCYRLDPRQVETLMLLERVFEALGQETKRAAVFRELGRLHDDEGRAADAHAAWTRVLELETEDPEALAALGTAPATPSQPPTQPAGGPTGAAAGDGPRPATSTAAAAGPELVAKVIGEAEVYVKYGLHEKALEHLQKVFSIDPEHVDAREKASRLRELRKDLAGAADDQARAIEGARARGLVDRARAGFERLRQLSPSHPALAQLAPSLEGVGTAAPRGEADGVILELDELTVEQPGATEQVEAAAVEEPAPGAAVELDAAPPPEPVWERAATPVADASPEAAPTLAAAAPVDGGTDALALSAVVAIGDELEEGPIVVSDDDTLPGVLERPGAAATSAAGPAVAAAPRAPTPADPVAPDEAGEEPLAEDLAEADFFAAQGLVDEARELLSALHERHPAHAGIASRLFALGDGEAPALAPRRPARAGASQRAIVPPPPTPDYLYSVRDVLEPFKKGIAQTVTPGDTQTHYDFGIAYKEMALLSDAIHEFEVALQGCEGTRRLDCLMLIGLCHLEGSDHARAVEAFRTALAGAPGGDQRSALEYNLALACEAAGDRDEAVRALTGLVAADPDYRDARERLARLGAASAPPSTAAPLAGPAASSRRGR